MSPDPYRFRVGNRRKIAFSFRLNKRARVFLTVRHINSWKEVFDADQELGAGYRSIVWNGRDHNSGRLVKSGKYRFRVVAMSPDFSERSAPAAKPFRVVR